MRIRARGLADLLFKPLLCAGSAVWTTRPAAGPAFSFAQILAQSFKMFLPRLGGLDDRDPADPFVSGKWRKTVPSFQYGRITQQSLLKILGHFVNDAGADRWSFHLPSFGCTDLFLIALKSPRPLPDPRIKYPSAPCSTGISPMFRAWTPGTDGWTVSPRSRQRE